MIPVLFLWKLLEKKGVYGARIDFCAESVQSFMIGSRIEIWTQDSEITLIHRSKLYSICCPKRELLNLIDVAVDFDDWCKVTGFCWM